jgi:outer membrane protein insertion porin family
MDGLAKSQHAAFIKGLFIVLLLQGCTATKFLKDNESFYTGAKIKLNPQGNIGRKKQIVTDLQEFITPKPNATLLSMRPEVWFYVKAGNPTKPKGFRNFVKNKLGKPPVLLSNTTPGKTAIALEGELYNNGYFGSEVTHEVVTKRKKSTVIYNVELHPPFRLRRINEFVYDSASNPKLAMEIKDGSLLRPKQRYKLERLQGEQLRLEKVFQNQGFYYFDDRHLLFEADSTVGKREIDLDLKFENDIPEKATRSYRVSEINVFPNYSLNNDSLKTTADTIRVDGFTYIDNQHNFFPHIITDVINLRPDSIYTRSNYDYTLNHLMGLKTFKFVNIKFTEDKTDTAALHANIFLTPLLKKSVQAQVQGVSKSNNFVGPGLEFTFSNRNMFKGAELFQLKLNTAYEVQISRQQAGALNAFELGAETSLAVPRIITPINVFRYNSAKYLPQTKVKMGYTVQQRLQYFKITTFNTGVGYTWRETTLKTHELYPIDISFVKKGKTSVSFDSLLASNPSLNNSFQDQFILGSHYSFIINTQLKDGVEEKFDKSEIRKSNFYFNGTIDLSGNLLNAIQSAGPEKNEPTDPFELFGAPYSQFAKGDIDFRYYYQFNRRNKLATRFIAGLGYAYGNSTTMPYVKQFSIGGSNSIRAFPARSVGPGSYNVRSDPTVSTYFIDQRADIKLESNAEYRFDIYKTVKGALFVDAGNIWLRKNDKAPLPDGLTEEEMDIYLKNQAAKTFNSKTFMDQLAVGTGAGLRFDFSFFVLRFDLAFPLRKPYLDPGQRWVIDDINFGDKEWRRQNLVLNIAIGYPF